MKKIFIVFLFISFSCSKKSQECIKLEMLPNNNYIVFDTYTNSTQGYFILDTHSSITVIFKKKGRVYDFKKTGVVKVNGVDVESVKIDSVVIGGFKTFNVDAVLIDDDDDTFLNMDGIFGLNIAEKLNWIFDFHNNTVELRNSKLNNQDFDIEIDYFEEKKNNSLPYLNAIVDKNILKLKIDTGFENELSVSDSLIFNKSKFEFDTASIADVFGRKEREIAEFTLDTLIVSKYSFTNIKTRYELSLKSSNLLGMKFFRRFKKFGIDSKQKKIFLKY